MMKAVAIRRFSHEGRTYAKGKTFEVPPSQFKDWLAAGLVEQAQEKIKPDKKPAE